MQRVKSLKSIIDEADHLYACEHKHAKALTKINEALRHDPDCVAALVLRGRILFQLNRLREMQQSYDKALRIDPRCSEVFLERAKVSSAIRQDYRTALREVEKALRYAGRSRWIRARALWLKGNVLADLERNQEALRCYRKGLRLNPKDYDMHFALGNALVGMKHPAKALPHLRRALTLLQSERSPNPSILELFLGTYAEVLNALGRHRSALG